VFIKGERCSPAHDETAEFDTDDDGECETVGVVTLAETDQRRRLAFPESGG